MDRVQIVRDTRQRANHRGIRAMDARHARCSVRRDVPDLAGWRRERMPTIVTDVPYFTLAPDWVCEVLSPRTAKLDRARKLPIYAREQVGHVWLVDPAERTLEALRREGSQWLLVGVWSDDTRVRAEPFDAIELELGALWADVEVRDETTAGQGL